MVMQGQRAGLQKPCFKYWTFGVNQDMWPEEMKKLYKGIRFSF